MHKRSFVALVIMTLSAFLAGCGGGGNSGVAPAATGRAVFTITWPSKARSTSRLIPAATQSLMIVLKDGDTTVGSQTLTHTDGNSTSSATFTNLPFKPLAVAASAYPTTDATGTPLASASLMVTVTGGDPATASLTMASTIDHIAVAYGKATLLVAEQAAVMATAYDASNNVVMLTPDALTWVSDAPSKATVAMAATGVLATGVGPGTAHITVTDTESTVSKEFDIVCMSFTLSPDSDQTISVQGSKTFTSAIAGPTDTSKTWSVTKSDGSVATDAGTVDNSGHYTAPSKPGADSFYYVQAASNYDPTRVRKVKFTIVYGNADIGVQ